MAKVYAEVLHEKERMGTVIRFTDFCRNYNNCWTYTLCNC